MKYFTWINSKVAKMKWYHISFIKLASIFFGLALAKYMPALIGYDWYVYFTGIILLSLVPIYAVFR